MIKTTLSKHILLGGIAVLSVVIALPVVTYAQDKPVEVQQRINDHKTVVQEKQQEHKEAAQEKRKEHKEATQARLQDSKLKACQNRQKAITNIMSRIADRGQKQINVFSIITQRVENFYMDKGKTLSNYDALVAEVAAKKAAAQATVDTVKSSSTTFDCNGDNPKGAADSFKESLKKVIEAIKAYKTAVNNLIVGVKSVQGTTSSAQGEQQ